MAAIKKGIVYVFSICMYTSAKGLKFVFFLSDIRPKFWFEFLYWKLYEFCSQRICLNKKRGLLSWNPRTTLHQVRYCLQIVFVKHAGRLLSWETRIFDSVKSETNLRYNLGKYTGLKVTSTLSIKKYTYSLLKNSFFCWEWMHWRGAGANYNWTNQCNIFLLLMNHDNKLLQNDNVNSQYFIPKKNYRRSGEFSSYLRPCERGAPGAER